MATECFCCHKGHVKYNTETQRRAVQVESHRDLGKNLGSWTLPLLYTALRYMCESTPWLQTCRHMALFRPQVLELQRRRQGTTDFSAVFPGAALVQGFKAWRTQD